MKKGIITGIGLFMWSGIKAQPAPPPPIEGGIPIDGVVAILIVLSLIYAARSLKTRKSSSIKGS